MLWLWKSGVNVEMTYLQHKEVTVRKWRDCIHPDKTTWPLGEIASTSANLKSLSLLPSGGYTVEVKKKVFSTGATAPFARPVFIGPFWRVAFYVQVDTLRSVDFTAHSEVWFTFKK